jgi:hypothetical protein
VPLTNNALPSIVPGRAYPIDTTQLFAQNQTFTATGYLNNGAATTQIDVDAGRLTGFWVIDLQTLKVTAGNETYQLALLGSNDPAFGNGNVELLAFHDWAAATCRQTVSDCDDPRRIAGGAGRERECPAARAALLEPDGRFRAALPASLPDGRRHGAQREALVLDHLRHRSQVRR